MNDPQARLREAEQEILARRPEHAIEPSLDRITALTELLGDPQPGLRVVHGCSRMTTVTLAAYVLCCRAQTAPRSPRRWGYLTKYQFSGLMLSVGLCGVTPLRLPAISVSW